MNYFLTGLLIGVVIALVFVVFYLYKRFFRSEEVPKNMRENYQEREDRKIEINRMPGATPELNEIMAELNETGNQMVADSEYDNVDTSVLQSN
jgi:hypothetical protein